MSFPKNKINLEVLLYALSQQVDPLPPTLQRSLTEIGQVSPANLTDEDKIKIRELVETYQPLEIVYRNALTQWNQSYVSQERAKSLDAIFPTLSGLDDLSIDSFVHTQDWVLSAQKILSPKKFPKQRSQFLERGDRIVTLASGGAFLGVLIAQIPGAFIGGILAGIYA